MAEFIFQSVRRIAHANWLFSGPRISDIGLVQYTSYSGQVSFSGKIFELILMKFKKNYLSKMKNSK